MGKSSEPVEAKKALGRRIQAWRLHRGMSQTELSTASGVSVDVIRSYEGGRNLASITNLEKFSTVLKVTLDRLVKEDPPVKGR